MKKNDNVQYISYISLSKINLNNYDVIVFDDHNIGSITSSILLSYIKQKDKQLIFLSSSINNNLLSILKQESNFSIHKYTYDDIKKLEKLYFRYKKIKKIKNKHLQTDNI